MSERLNELETDVACNYDEIVEMRAALRRALGRIADLEEMVRIRDEALARYRSLMSTLGGPVKHPIQAPGMGGTAPNTDAEADFVIAMERYEHVERIAGGLKEASLLRANLRAVRAQEHFDAWVDEFLADACSWELPGGGQHA